jgi:hypothetical protein
MYWTKISQVKLHPRTLIKFCQLTNVSENQQVVHNSSPCYETQATRGQNFGNKIRSFDHFHSSEYSSRPFVVIKKQIGWRVAFGDAASSAKLTVAELTPPHCDVFFAHDAHQM